ncbi:hypothetical protein FQZ97_1180630 [compost metagenome]
METRIVSLEKLAKPGQALTEFTGCRGRIEIGRCKQAVGWESHQQCRGPPWHGDDRAHGMFRAFGTVGNVRNGSGLPDDRCGKSRRVNELVSSDQRAAADDC